MLLVVICGLSFKVRCVLRVACCLMFVVCCLLCVVCCCVFVWHVACIVCWRVLVVCGLPSLGAYYVLVRVVRGLLFVCR